MAWPQGCTQSSPSSLFAATPKLSCRAQEAGSARSMCGGVCGFAQWGHACGTQCLAWEGLEPPAVVNFNCSFVRKPLRAYPQPVIFCFVSEDKSDLLQVQLLCKHTLFLTFLLPLPCPCSPPAHTAGLAQLRAPKCTMSTNPMNTKPTRFVASWLLCKDSWQPTASFLHLRVLLLPCCSKLSRSDNVCSPASQGEWEDA